MVKTYPEFLDVITSKTELYEQIPEEHLTFAGKNVFELYKAVLFVTGFASNAAELLALLNEDEDVAFQAQYEGADSEYRKIRRCLERLAAPETVPTT